MTTRNSLLHIALPEDWKVAQASGEYAVSTRGALISQVGLMHGSWDADQALKIWNVIYADRPDIVVLEMSVSALADAGLTVREEPGDPTDPASERFPHVYGGPVPVKLMSLRDGRLKALCEERV